MKVIGELYKPDIAMLPIGGIYTMDIDAAETASTWLQAYEIIPMHYNTFDAIKVNMAEFEESIKGLWKVPVVMEIGKNINV